MKLYLARHGRSVGRGLFLGQSDPGLSDEGRTQARALAEQLLVAGVEHIVCSTLKRSAETAAIVAQRIHGEPVQDPRLNELAYGRWDGLPWEEIERRWPDEAQSKLDDWWGITPENGETRAAFYSRVRSFWEELQSSNAATLVVGHAGVNGLLAELARVGAAAPDWERVTRFEQGYGEVRVLSVS